MHASLRWIHSARWVMIALSLPVTAVIGCATSASQTKSPGEARSSRTARLVVSHPEIGRPYWSRRSEALIVPASAESAVRVVYATFGIVLPTVPLRMTGQPSADTVLKSAPVSVGDQQVIYRLRRSGVDHQYLMLDAVVMADSSESVVKYAPAGFGQRAWIPIEAVAEKFFPPDTLSGDRDSQWRPKGCPRSISSWSYCS